MKVSDFKLLTTLPDGYDYSIVEDNNNNILILGKNYQTVIGLRIIKNELRPVVFEVVPKGDEYR